MEVKIRKSITGDDYEIEEVRKITWINTYPNKKAEITVTDIESKLKNNASAKAKRKSEGKKRNHGNETKQTWVAENNGKIIGFCVVEKNIENRILAIYVLPEHQGKGIGSRLLINGLKWLGDDKKIYVNVVEYNLNAINFYEKHGFIKTGERGVFDSGAKFPNGKSMIEIKLLKSNS